MKEKTVYVFLYDGRLFLIESPSLLLEYHPNTFVNDSISTKSTDYRWAYRDNSGNIVKTDFPCCNFYLKESSNDGSKHSILLIESDLASKINILPGSKLNYTVDYENKILIVEKIDNQPVGQANPEIKSSYPNQMIPLDNWGFTSMRILSLLAPIGFGQCNYIVAPGNCGKTSLLLEVWESLLRLTKVLPNLYVVFLVIGERKKDASLYKDIQDSVDHVKDRVEFYSASSPDIEEIQKYSSSKILQGQWRLFDYLTTQRVTSLAKKWDCFVGVDSLHRAAAAHSFGNMASSSSLMGGGFNTQSMLEATTRVNTAANFGGGRSLTTMSALIGNYNRSGGKPSVLENISRETADHVPDSVWSLTDIAMRYPKIDLDGYKTRTRRDEEFAPKHLLQERGAVQKLIWGMSKNENPGSKADRALEALIDYCKSKAIPKWAVSTLKTPIIPKHLEAIYSSGLDQESIPIAYLTSNDISQDIIKLSKKTGMDQGKIIENALKLYLKSLEISSINKEMRFFVGPKPGDEIIEVLLQPDILSKKIE